MKRQGRFEGAAQVIILVSVALMAGAASFKHVHDWTMHNSPQRTGGWFGWANAMVTELIPLAAALEMRRRRRHNLPVGKYPVALILGAIALSLAGQIAEAKPSASGWLISAIPALGFLALVKLVLSSPQAAETVETVDTVEPVDVRPVPEPRVEPVPDHLVPTARFAVTNHESTMGRPITADELAARMSVTPAIAGQLLEQVGR
jgi:hypothetical protein